MLIYEKENENALLPANTKFHQSDDDPIVFSNDDNSNEIDFHFHTNKKEKCKLQPSSSTELSSDNIESKISKLSEVNIFDTEIVDTENEIEPKSSYSGTAETSEHKGYVICPDKDCDERIMINSDDEVADCKICGTMSNLSFLELFPMPSSEDMNRQSLMKELERQKEKNRSNCKNEKNKSLNKTPVKRRKTSSTC